MIYNSFTVKNLNVVKKKNFNNLFNGLLLKVYQMELKILAIFVTAGKKLFFKCNFHFSVFQG